MYIYIYIYIYFSLLTYASLRSTKYNLLYHYFIEYYCINIIVRERQLLSCKNLLSNPIDYILSIK